MKAGSIRLNRPLRQTLKGRIEPYEFEVGILRDGPHYRAATGRPRPTLKTFAGGPARRTSRSIDGTLSGVSKSIRENLGINYLTEPFKKRNDDAVKLLQGFFKFVFAEKKQNHQKRVENLVQAVVRNPILRGDYGSNSPLTAKIKGFDRLFIDTAQLFRAITARVKINSAARRRGGR